jgi:predicted HTH transcriptional regulator
MTRHRYAIEDLRKMCEDRREETVALEFKPCNELRAGIIRNRKRLSRDDIILELSRDVSSFLNSAGGSIICGIREQKSRARNLDSSSSYRTHNDPTTEKITEWIRAHIRPPPTVEVYSVFERHLEQDSPWYLVVEIPQGDTPFQAKDKRFY